jgi:hypothetical protein
LRELISSASPDFARSARVVAFAFSSRFEPVVMLNPAYRAEYRASPPPAPPARFHSVFWRGECEKEWAAGGRGGASFSRFQEKEAGGIQYKWSLVIQNSLRNGEALY